MSDDVDVVILGVGPGGEYAATKLAEAGLRVVAVERALVGGECPFWGCIPSKLLIRAADVLGEARRVDRLAGRAEVAADIGPALVRIREANHDWHDASHTEPLEQAGVRIVRGHGRLDGPGRVVVETEDGSVTLTAARGVLLNVGTAPAVPPIPGLAETPYWTNRDVFGVSEAPSSMVVIGGGPIGAELAQAFARFGARVRLLEVADRILGPEEPEAAAVLTEVLRREGLDVRAGVSIDRIDHDGEFVVRIGDDQLRAERLLVATGRRTQLADLGLESVGLDAEARFLDVDERLRAAEKVWAVGDITGHGAFTHVSLYQAAVAVRDLLGQAGPPADYRAVSRVTFTDPEVGSVGLTEKQARDTGLRVAVGHAELPSSSRGWLHGPGNDGLIKVVADADRRILVGATAMGPYGGEILGMLVTAVHAEVPIDVLRSMHFAYPTLHRTIESALHDLPV